VAYWTSHPPQEQKTRVQIPPRNEVFRENIAMHYGLKMHFYSIKKINNGIGRQNNTNDHYILYIVSQQVLLKM
jgi:hypothetical protein